MKRIAFDKPPEHTRGDASIFIGQLPILDRWGSEVTVRRKENSDVILDSDEKAGDSYSINLTPFQAVELARRLLSAAGKLD